MDRKLLFNTCLNRTSIQCIECVSSKWNKVWCGRAWINFINKWQFCRHFEHIIHIRRCRIYIHILFLFFLNNGRDYIIYFLYLFSYKRLKRLIFMPNSRKKNLYNFSQSIVWFKALLLIPIQLFVSLEQVQLLLIWI